MSQARAKRIWLKNKKNETEQFWGRSMWAIESNRNLISSFYKERMKRRRSKMMREQVIRLWAIHRVCRIQRRSWNRTGIWDSALGKSPKRKLMDCLRRGGRMILCVLWKCREINRWTWTQEDIGTFKLRSRTGRAGWNKQMPWTRYKNTTEISKSRRRQKRLELVYQMRCTKEAQH